MKTIKKMSGAFAFAFVLFMLGSTNAKAQFCYKFFNNTGCTIEFEYELFNGGGCTTSCTVVPGQVVPPMTRFDIPCGSCSPTCNGGVRITRVNGVGVNVAQLLLTGTSVSVPGVGGCPAFTLSIIMGPSFEAL